MPWAGGLAGLPVLSERQGAGHCREFTGSPSPCGGHPMIPCGEDDGRNKMQGHGRLYGISSTGHVFKIPPQKYAQQCL